LHHSYVVFFTSALQGRIFNIALRV